MPTTQVVEINHREAAEVLLKGLYSIPARRREKTHVMELNPLLLTGAHEDRINRNTPYQEEAKEASLINDRYYFVSLCTMIYRFIKRSEDRLAGPGMNLYESI
jgi:hypothetical protein